MAEILHQLRLVVEIPLFIGFHTSQVVQDFSHQQCHPIPPFCWMPQTPMMIETSFRWGLWDWHLWIQILSLISPPPFGAPGKWHPVKGVVVMFCLWNSVVVFFFSQRVVSHVIFYFFLGGEGWRSMLKGKEMLIGRWWYWWWNVVEKTWQGDVEETNWWVIFEIVMCVVIVNIFKNFKQLPITFQSKNAI